MIKIKYLSHLPKVALTINNTQTYEIGHNIFMYIDRYIWIYV